ncbi:Ribosomal RNA-processing protein 8 [Anthophora retusa]
MAKAIKKQISNKKKVNKKVNEKKVLQSEEDNENKNKLPKVKDRNLKFKGKHKKSKIVKTIQQIRANVENCTSAKIVKFDAAKIINTKKKGQGKKVQFQIQNEKKQQLKHGKQKQNKNQNKKKIPNQSDNKVVKNEKFLKAKKFKPEKFKARKLQKVDNEAQKASSKLEKKQKKTKPEKPSLMLNKKQKKAKPEKFKTRQKQEMDSKAQKQSSVSQKKGKKAKPDQSSSISIKKQKKAKPNKSNSMPTKKQKGTKSEKLNLMSIKKQKMIKSLKLHKKGNNNPEETSNPHNLDIKQLKELLVVKRREKKREKENAKPQTLRERMMDKLKASRFRYLNETLYNNNSSESKKYFKNDPDSFKAYHEGYKQQVDQWPLNPLDNIISSIKKLPKEYIIADFGCGEARLATAVPHKVHSFDFVSLNENVTVCDMAHTPLLTNGVHVVVFCLSLMGTNLSDYIIEANRVLKKDGILKIAEVESRFDQVEDFIKAVTSYGFKCTWQDLSHNLFYFLDFKKETDIGSRRNKLPLITLKPCLYKKR